MDMIVKQAIITALSADGSSVQVTVVGQSTALQAVKNATGRKLTKGQKVLIHYRGALTQNDPAYITAILEGAVD